MKHPLRVFLGLIFGALMLASVFAILFPRPRAAVAQGILALVVEKPGNPAPTHVIANGNRGFNNAVNADRECDKVVAITTLGTNANVQQIAAVAGQNIYLCGWILFGSTAVAGIDLLWSEGTGTNCATGLAAVGGKFLTTPTAATTTPNSVYGPSNPALKMTATAGDALCIQQSSATNSTALAGLLFYTQGS